jgi:ferritin-like metal-binding protein YciE
MSTSDQKVLQYLNEARAMELSLVRVLQSQMAMTPHGSYRDALERHLDETRDHAERVGVRLEELGHRGDPLTAAVGVVETVIGQALAIGKAPFDMVRGSGGEEKVLKNAKDAHATEALEIATYAALERLARTVGDVTTAQLAQSIRSDEERMLARVLREIPKLTDAVVGADVKGESSYEENLPVARYDTLTAEEIAGKLPELSQIDLAKIEAYERKNQNRSTILRRVTSLRSDEPWAGYDELTAAEVIAVLSEGDDDRAKDVRSYERGHKDRAGVLKAAERELTNA